jgi:hypothetical protein
MSNIPSPEISEHLGERFLTVHEIAMRWALSSVSVRRLFLHEPGVLVMGTREVQTRARKRVYRTLRIPESVVRRVERRLSNGSSG